MTDVATTKRRKLSTRDRLSIWERDKGCCYLCERKLRPGDKWIAEHPRALELGGADDINLLRVACAWCATDKTRDDHRRAARSKRMKARHIGGPRSGFRGFRGWRRFNGKVVWRDG